METMSEKFDYFKFQENFTQVKTYSSCLYGKVNGQPDDDFFFPLLSAMTEVDQLIEKVRAACLKRGAAGIKGIGRYAHSLFVSVGCSRDIP